MNRNGNPQTNFLEIKGILSCNDQIKEELETKSGKYIENNE